MTLDEFMEQVKLELQMLGDALSDAQKKAELAQIARQEIFAEELQRVKHDVSALKSKVFELENKGVGE